MMQRQFSTIQLVQNKAELPPTHHVDKVVEMQVVVQRQVSVFAKVRETAEVPQVQYINREVDVPVAAQMHFRRQWRCHRCSSPTRWLMSLRLCSWIRVVDVPVVQEPTIQTEEKLEVDVPFVT